MPKAEADNEISIKSFQKLVDQINNIENNIEKINTEILDLKNNEKITQDSIKAKDEITLNKLSTLNEQFSTEINRVTSELERMKNELDIFKISFTVNENQLLNTIKKLIKNEMTSAIKNKEILMKKWIEDLKEIISNFEDLKKLQPKEFNLQIREIISTIDMFKKKL